MIKGFSGKFADSIWAGKVGKGFPADLIRPAQRKLAMLNAAVTIEALRVEGGRRL